MPTTDWLSGETKTAPSGWSRLKKHLRQADALQQVVPDQSLLAAQIALQLGEPELAYALLVKTGGLYDKAKSRDLLLKAAPTPNAELLRQVTAQPTWPDPVAEPEPHWSATESELYIRILAAFLAQDKPVQLPDAPDPLIAASFGTSGLARLPMLPETQRWTLGLGLVKSYIEQRSAAGLAPLTPALTWCNASWGGRWGVSQRLQEAGLSTQVAVISLEQVLASLSAASPPELSGLPALLSRPLLIEGLSTLSPERFQTLTQLLSDAETVFGWTTLSLPGLERPWPAAFKLAALPTDSTAVTESTSRPTFFHLPHQSSLSLPALAKQVQQAKGDRLVLLYSRASAARLAAKLPGSVLLSSSLSRVHLDDRMSVLAQRRQQGEQVTVIATTLPSTPIGTFDQVWHVMAPLPHLVEAEQLSHGEFHLIRLSDVPVPGVWQAAIYITEELLYDGDPLSNPELQRRYFEQLEANERSFQLPYLTELRRDWDFESLAREIGTTAGSSVPVLIPYNQPSEEAIARYRQTGHLSASDLRYAAWLTPMEASAAVRRGQAQRGKTALIWEAPYDLDYGLAASLVYSTTDNDI